MQTARASVTPGRAKAADSVWHNIWLPYLATLGIDDPYLRHVPDPVPFLQVLAERIRDGRCSRSGKSVKAAHVRDELLAVAKAFTTLGYSDPRHTRTGDMDPRLAALFKGMSNADPAPVRVKPMPIQVLHHAQATVQLAPTDLLRCIMDMAWIAFFYLLRPGEYCKSPENTPLALKDVSCSIGFRKLDILHCPHQELDRATQSSLTFDDQKNRERGETVAHTRSGHTIACPTRALVRRIKYLRLAGAGPDTYLCAVRPGLRWISVTSKSVSSLLKTSAAALPNLNYGPADVEARSLRAGGAMALLCGKVDRDTIRLVGRWKSDAMFRYLHAQALPLIRDLASTMLQHGSFYLAPGADVPAPAAPLFAAQE